MYTDAELSLEMYSRGPRSWDVWREGGGGGGVGLYLTLHCHHQNHTRVSVITAGTLKLAKKRS